MIPSPNRSAGRILVTGAAGFIGRSCLPLLAAAGYQVHGLVRRLDGLPAGPYHWHQWDMLADRSPDDMLAAIAPTHVLHLAWVTTPGIFWHTAENDRWVGASLRFLRAAVAAGAGRIIVSGSVAEYDWSAPLPFGPETPLRPDKPYGLAKNALRQQLETMAAERDVDLAWGRIHYLYGPHEQPERLVPQIIRALLAGRPIETTDGRQRRDFLHVDDIARGLLALIRSDIVGAVDLGSGQAIAVSEVITAIGEVIGRPDLIHLGARPRAADDPDLLVAKPSPLQGPGLWQPRIGLAEGLQQTIDWWRRCSLPEHETAHKP